MSAVPERVSQQQIPGKHTLKSQNSSRPGGKGVRAWTELHRGVAASEEDTTARTSQEDIRVEDHGMRTSFVCNEEAQNLHSCS